MVQQIYSCFYKKEIFYKKLFTFAPVKNQFLYSSSSLLSYLRGGEAYLKN